jgi:hypothetical protein
MVASACVKQVDIIDPDMDTVLLWVDLWSSMPQLRGFKLFAGIWLGPLGPCRFSGNQSSQR